MKVIDILKWIFEQSKDLVEFITNWFKGATNE